MKNKSLFLNKRIKHLIILLLVFNSCTKDNDQIDADNFDLNGSYELTITGDENRDLSGEANFLQVVVSNGTPGSGGASLVVNLTSGDEESLALTFAQEEEKIFSVDKYTYTLEALEGSTYFSAGFYSSLSSFTYLISSGSISLTKVSNTLIEGTIDIIMSNNSNDDILNVKGSFKAVGFTQIY